jgi:predicted nucleic acid-binding protein
VPIVIDASITMAWGFRDETTPFSRAIYWRVYADRALVPAIWPLEIANTILVGERRGRIAQSESVRFLTVLRSMPITVDEETTLRAWMDILPLARQLNLSAYDASYLDLAIRRGLPLATADRRMREAATLLGLELVEYAEGNDENDQRI